MEDREVYEVAVSSNGHAPQPTTVAVTALCALDRLFDATGTAEVKVGGKTLALPIQSVDLEQVEALCKPFRPKPPIKRDQVQGKWVTIIDEAHEGYRDALMRYNMLYAHVTALCGLVVDVKNAQREVVWAADNHVHDVEQAVKALKDMGLVLNHVIAINRAINELTAVVEDQRLGE